MPIPYSSFDDLLERVDEPHRSGLQRILSIYRDRIQSARGSSYNHQAWTGGYADHVREVMNCAVALYQTMSQLRPLPFTLSDALVVLFVHDLEKPWAYEEVDGTWRRKPGLKENAHAVRMDKLAEANVALPAELEQAMRFVEGEGSDYSNQARGMSPLAAFCHMCDVASARVWHDFPLEQGDPWVGARRSTAESDSATDRAPVV